jgi:hypothetical protein
MHQISKDVVLYPLKSDAMHRISEDVVSYPPKSNVMHRSREEMMRKPLVLEDFLPNPMQCIGLGRR